MLHTLRRSLQPLHLVALLCLAGPVALTSLTPEWRGGVAEARGHHHGGHRHGHRHERQRRNMRYATRHERHERHERRRDYQDERRERYERRRDYQDERHERWERRYDARRTAVAIGATAVIVNAVID
ncbi:MAG: hypothetical protein ACFCBW_20805 [Candidatus Competibacterales bacterium]